MKFHFLFIFIFSILILGCKKNEDLSELQVTIIDYTAITSNDYDKNRLCMGEAISKLMLEEKFREFVKSKTVNESNNWNKEILLIKYWNKEIFDGFTLYELLAQTIVNNPDICAESIEKFEAMLFDDPVLALKIPDIIDAKEWDTKNTVPFLYIKTNDLVKNGLTTDSASIVGIHGSGVIDRYYWGVPKYYPIVLKKSEDYFLVDRYLNMSNGVNLNLYHDYNPNILSLEVLLTEPLYIKNEERYLVEINSLIKTIN